MRLEFDEKLPPHGESCDMINFERKLEMDETDKLIVVLKEKIELQDRVIDLLNREIEALGALQKLSDIYCLSQGCNPLSSLKKPPESKG